MLLKYKNQGEKMTVVKNSRIKISNRPSEPTLDLTLVAPVYNEEDSIELLVQGVSNVLDELKISYEFICIDDGSHDNSASKIKELIKIHNNLKLITFWKNYGQTAAIMAGIDHSLGRVIICIDADLQNDPADIPKLLEKLSEGYDVVSGWRKNRKDAKIKRVFLSNLANRIISYVSGVNLKDYGCTLKAYRREVVHGSRLYGEMHRFIPIYASWNGAKITEIPVAHHARRFGYSKYGIGRVVKVILGNL